MRASKLKWRGETTTMGLHELHAVVISPSGKTHKIRHFIGSNMFKCFDKDLVQILDLNHLELACWLADKEPA